LLDEHDKLGYLLQGYNNKLKNGTSNSELQFR